jgi:hypothetical protein
MLVRVRVEVLPVLHLRLQIHLSLLVPQPSADEVLLPPEHEGREDKGSEHDGSKGSEHDGSKGSAHMQGQQNIPGVGSFRQLRMTAERQQHQTERQRGKEMRT